MSRTKFSETGDDAEWEHSAFRTRFYPKGNARTEVDRTLDAAARFYDHALAHRLASTKCSESCSPDGEPQPVVDYRVQQDMIPRWRQVLAYLHRIPVVVIRDVLLRAEQAFEDKEQPKTKAEKYGKCKDFKKSVSYIGNFETMHFDPDGSTVKLPYIPKPIRFGNIPAELPDGFRITKITVAKEWGKYWLSVSYKYPKRPVAVPMTAVGLDLGVTNTVALSDGSDPKRFNMPTANELRIAELQERKQHLQRSLSRKVGSQEGETKSDNYMKVLDRIRAAERKAVNICNNHRHHITANIRKEYGLAVIEKLEVKQLMRKSNSALARRMAKTGWGDIIRMLKHKMGEDRVVEVNPAKTSQRCSDCGVASRKNRRGEKFRCGRCGYANHADTNASVNILEAGIVSEPGKFAGFLKMDQGRGGLKARRIARDASSRSSSC